MEENGLLKNIELGAEMISLTKKELEKIRGKAFQEGVVVTSVIYIIVTIIFAMLGLA